MWTRSSPAESVFLAISGLRDPLDSRCFLCRSTCRRESPEPTQHQPRSGSGHRHPAAARNKALREDGAGGTWPDKCRSGDISALPSAEGQCRPHRSSLRQLLRSRSRNTRPGDTLFKIARANGVSVDALMRANLSANPVRLRPGRERIQIPPAQGRLPRNPDFWPGQIRRWWRDWYVVKAGDTLTRLAKQYHTTVQAMQALNQLNSTRLLVGQKLKVPQTVPSGNLAGSTNAVSNSKLSTAPLRPDATVWMLA